MSVRRRLSGLEKAAGEDPNNHPLDCGCEECA